MTDRELLELLLDKVTSMETDIKDIKKDLRAVQEQTATLTEFREETYKGFDNLESKLDDIEANNADRHVYINRELKSIKAGLNKVEIITADNWGEIAKIKSTRIHKTK